MVPDHLICIVPSENNISECLTKHSWNKKSFHISPFQPQKSTVLIACVFCFVWLVVSFSLEIKKWSCTVKISLVCFKRKKRGEDGEHFIVYGLYLTSLLTVFFRCFALKLNINNAKWMPKSTALLDKWYHWAQVVIYSDIKLLACN